MKTLKSFVSASHISESLISAVVKQAGNWDSFKDIASDATDHGADSGFSGFIYYSDTVLFTENNKQEIVNLCKELASDFGTNWLDLIASFNCLDMTSDEIADVFAGFGDDCDTEQVYNALAWFALEEVSRSYCDLLEDC